MKNLFFAILTMAVLTSCTKDDDDSSFGPIVFTNITKTSITIKWNQDLAEFEKYEIYRNMKLIKTIDDVETTSYTDDELTPNTSYDYKVKAVLDDDDNRFILINGTAKTLE